MSVPRKPDFENFMVALNCEEPKRVPLGDYSVDPILVDQFMGKPVRTLKENIEFRQAAGFDFIAHLAGIYELFGVSHGINTKEGDASTADGGKRTRVWADEQEGIITNWEQFEKYPWPNADDFDLSTWDELDRIVPSGMKVVLTLGKIYTPVWMFMGAETFFEALQFNEPLIAAMFEKIGAIQYEVMQRVVEHPCVGAVHNPDDIAHNTGMLVDPKYLRKYLFPWYKKIGRVCRDRGIGFMFHSDGDCTEVMDDLVEAGFQGFNPIQPNCMDIDEVKRKWGHKLCLIGNINLDSTLTLGSPQDVRAEVYERIRTVGPGGGYMVASSNSLADYVPLANMKAMIEATFEYGTYPLNLEAGKIEGKFWTFQGKQTSGAKPGGGAASDANYLKAMITKNVDELKALAAVDMQNGMAATEIVSKKLIPAMRLVGEKFQEGEYFIPEMMMAAQAMSAVIDSLEDQLAGGASENKGKVVIGTVQGDLHDIGKNLVAMMLKGQGFEVIDLGLSVKTEDFTKAVIEHKPDVLAMSALLTTTMVEMRNNINAITEMGIRDQVKVIVGGAPVTAQFAAEIGADAYAYDAPGAAQKCEELLAV